MSTCTGFLPSTPRYSISHLLPKNKSNKASTSSDQNKDIALRSVQIEGKKAKSNTQKEKKYQNKRRGRRRRDKLKY
jgi:hypothetical protein